MMFSSVKAQLMAGVFKLFCSQPRFHICIGPQPTTCMFVSISFVFKGQNWMKVLLKAPLNTTIGLLTKKKKGEKKISTCQLWQQNAIIFRSNFIPILIKAKKKKVCLTTFLPKKLLVSAMVFLGVLFFSVFGPLFFFGGGSFHSQFFSICYWQLKKKRQKLGSACRAMQQKWVHIPMHASSWYKPCFFSWQVCGWWSLLVNRIRRPLSYIWG